jgi:two-component system CitB family response regulator
MINVMIVEDDPMVREINSKFLKRLDGFTLVKAARNLEEAKEFILNNSIDLILLDIFLPKENGIDLLKWLRSQNFTTDIIMITADNAIESVQEAFRFGVIDYLIKPFSFQRFRESLYQFKERVNKFQAQKTIKQEELDKLITSPNNNSGFKNLNEESLEKGLNRYTYKKIWEAIVEENNDYYTAEKLAEELRIARVTVRKYLEYMTKEKKVEKLIEYGKVGRPQHRYRMIQLDTN